MFERVLKMARQFWKPDFVQGETLGAVAIVTTVLMVVESQVDPKSVVAPMLAVILHSFRWGSCSVVVSDRMIPASSSQ